MQGITGAMRHGLALLAGLLATVYGSWILGFVTLGIGLLAESSHKLRFRARK